jgi:hypothetical protein
MCNQDRETSTFVRNYGGASSYCWLVYCAYFEHAVITALSGAPVSTLLSRPLQAACFREKETIFSTFFSKKFVFA